MNYKNEGEHDAFFMSLVQELAKNKALDIFNKYFSTDTEVGALKWAVRKRAYDVEMAFDNAAFMIETKVDSNEHGGWGEPWQTENIHLLSSKATYLGAHKRLLFITYGMSEFYVKWGWEPNGTCWFKNGAASKHFEHITLQKMESFVSEALDHVSDTRDRWGEWLGAMRVEIKKRSLIRPICAELAKLRQLYLSACNAEEIDFPPHRATINLPELAFPLFSELANLWNNSDALNTFGGAAVYPVGRQMRVHDSILNLMELWEDPWKYNNVMTCGGILSIEKGEANQLYFELNEDFNLHLKYDGEEPSRLREFVHGRDKQLRAVGGGKGKKEDYKQETYVFYEWDIGLLNNVEDLPAVARTLRQVVQGTINLLK